MVLAINAPQTAYSGPGSGKYRQDWISAASLCIGVFGFANGDRVLETRNGLGRGDDNGGGL
jgi:hypothetical protein